MSATAKAPPPVTRHSQLSARTCADMKLKGYLKAIAGSDRVGRLLPLVEHPELKEAA